MLVLLSKPANSTALELSEMAVLLFGVVLVIGLIGEYAKAERWKKYLRVFEVFVIVGVAGELLGDGGIFLFSERLQAINNLEIASLNQSAADAQREAGRAIERAGKLEREAAEAQKQTQQAIMRAAIANERAQKEARARAAMLSQLQPRDFTEEQMDAFVATINGKVATLNVFTLSDPEAAAFGFEVMDGLQKAGVKVTWYSTVSSYFAVPGVSSAGLTVYESPKKEVGKILMEAFSKAGQSAGWFTPERPSDQDVRLPAGAVPLSSIPSPALFIALKQPAFGTFPRYLEPPSLKAIRPPWDPK